MILIGENLHIISNSVKQALITRDEDFIKNLICVQNNMDFIDLNVGPTKGSMEGILSWLSKLVSENSSCGISFDTTNIAEMESGLNSFLGKTFINSTTKDEPKLSKSIDLAIEHDSNLIALTMSKETGIPKTADERLEIAFEIYEKCIEKGLESEKIFFDPLILPVCVDQSQAIEALNTIKMVKESFDPPVKTVIGLSNISNGAFQRSLLNRVYAVMAYGAGLDAAIIDAKDIELVRILKMLIKNEPKNEIDNLYINLTKIISDFGVISDLDYDTKSKEQTEVIKAANILLNNEVYSHSFTQI